MDEQMMDLLFTEIRDNLQTMANAKNLEEKLEYSKIVKNLTQSLSFLTDSFSTFAEYDNYEDFMEE